MQEIYEAIDQLSMLLAMRVENSVRKRGWPGQPYKERFEVHGGGHTCYPTLLRLALPLGPSAIFVPDPAPAEGGASWLIRIRRTDGVARQSWADGVRVALHEGHHHLMVGDKVLSEALLNQILDELSSAGLSGRQLMISKAWVARFGPLPPAIYELLAGARDIEQLDRMHEAVLTEPAQREVETALARLSRPA